MRIARIFALATATMLATPAAAAGWDIVATPYFMAPNMDGKMGIRRFDATVDASPSDVFSNLNWGIMGSLEANNGDWGFNLDVNYMNLDATDDDRRLSVNGHQAAYTAILLKRVHRYAWVYAGARYNDLGVDLECKGGCTIPVALRGTQADRSRSKGWVDPLVGFRAELPFNDTLDLTVIADVGGFGAGSKISVNVWPQLGIRIGGSSKAMVGYRIIYVDYESGTGPDRFLYDVTTFGPTIGVQFRF